eukprot:UN3592
MARGFMRFWPCVQVQRGSGRAFSAYGLDAPCYFSVWPSLGRILVVFLGLSFCLAAGPVYWCWLLWEHRRRQAALAPDTDWKLIGYLTKNYKAEWKWWEVCVLLRKGMLVTSMAMTPASYAPGCHLRMPLVIIMLALLMQVQFRPFKSNFINSIEAASLSVSLTLLVLSSWVISPSWNEAEWVKYATLVLVFGLMALTILSLISLYAQASIGPQRIAAVRRAAEAVHLQRFAVLVRPFRLEDD